MKRIGYLGRFLVLGVGLVAVCVCGTALALPIIPEAITITDLNEYGVDVAATVHSGHSYHSAGFEPYRAFDINTATGWATAGGKAPPTIDNFLSICLTNGLAGGTASIHGFTWQNRAADADLVKSIEAKFYSDEFVTQVGSSGIVTGLTATATNITFAPVSNVRYVRFSVQDTGLGNPGAREIRFRGVLPVHTPITLFNFLGVGKNMAAEIYSFHSHYAGQSWGDVTNAFSGSSARQWAANTSSKTLPIEDWLSVDLTPGLSAAGLSGAKINGLAFQNRGAAADAATSFEIKFYSDEFVTQVGSSGVITGVPAAPTATNITFATVGNVKYLRFRLLGMAQTWGNAGAAHIQFTTEPIMRGTIIIVL